MAKEDIHELQQLFTKKGLLDTLLLQSYNICADYPTSHNKIKYFKTVWQKNSLPLFFIDNCIKFFLDKLLHVRKQCYKQKPSS